jgi:hypothetical protein
MRRCRNILLKADADADRPRWPDAKIAEAYGCSQCGPWRISVSDWLQWASTPRKLDGVGEAKPIAMRLYPKI